MRKFLSRVAVTAALFIALPFGLLLAAAEIGIDTKDDLKDLWSGKWDDDPYEPAGGTD